ncbi:MAG: UvrD-helicase domain-containing protein [Methanophagales archaeon]|nr:UvrD-helicase domain-containing protein [Methanophagales archaeon]
MAWNEGLKGPVLEIAKTDHTPLRIMAGPGTGKTFALMRRIARLLEKDSIDPSKGLLVTFTRITAADLVKELS